MVPLALGCAWALVVVAPLCVRLARRGPRLRAGVLRIASAPPAPRRVTLMARIPTATVLGRVGRVIGAPRTRTRRRARAQAIERAMPLALDVLTMASRAGFTPRLALATTARWSPPEIGSVLADVERQCRLGAALAEALDEVGRREPELRPFAEALAVAERSGAPTAELLGRLADEARATLRRRSEAHARRVPVRLLFPLVFLVLPAFGLLTVVPALSAGLRSS
jgi:tight adherence protein C